MRHIGWVVRTGCAWTLVQRSVWRCDGDDALARTHSIVSTISFSSALISSITSRTSESLYTGSQSLRFSSSNKSRTLRPYVN